MQHGNMQIGSRLGFVTDLPDLCEVHLEQVEDESHQWGLASLCFLGMAQREIAAKRARGGLVPCLRFCHTEN